MGNKGSCVATNMKLYFECYRDIGCYWIVSYNIPKRLATVVSGSNHWSSLVIIQPLPVYAPSPSTTKFPSQCFSFSSNRLPQSCGTSAQGAQKDTRASQVVRKEYQMQLEEVMLLTSKMSNRYIHKIKSWGER